MDPSQMSDEELDAAIAGNPPEETATNDGGQEAAPPDNGGQPDAPAAEPETPVAEPESPAEPGNNEPPAPSRREQLRVQQLLERYGQPPARPAPSKSQPAAPDFRDAIDAPDEVYDDLAARTKDFGATEYNRGSQEALAIADSIRWETRLNIDAPQVEAKYPILDKTSDQFHPALADALSRRYLSMVGFDPRTNTVSNPGLRWKDFVESEMELADEIATTRSIETTKEVVKQVAHTGLRPDGSTAKRLDLNKAPEDMSDEELDAVIAQSVPPRDNQGRFLPRT